MKALAIHRGRPAPAVLDDALRRASTSALTYDDVGATLTAAAAVRRSSVALGSAAGTYERACDGIRGWVCHAGIGATLHPATPPVEVGTPVVVALPFGPFTILAPTRIVVVVEETNRFGFAYGTLPGHPERGEESFLVERQDDGRVDFTIGVLASATPLLRPLAPVIGVAQRRALARYLRSMRAHVRL